MTDALDPKTLQRVYDKAAWRYDTQHGLLTAFSDQRGRKRLVEQTVRPGDRVLDAGGGTGSTALLAARAAGKNGHVTLVDLSDGMLAQARQRAEAEKLSERIDCQQGDLNQLAFPEASFDVVLSTYSLCPMQRPENAALELYRRVRPGGRLGIAHSVEPDNRMVRWLADGVEAIISHWHALSLGCRSIDVEATLVEAGARKYYDRMIGIPLWPFRVLVFEKPDAGNAGH